MALREDLDGAADLVFVALCQYIDCCGTSGLIEMLPSVSYATLASISNVTQRELAVQQQ